MICLAHEGTPYGHLMVARKVILPRDLAHMVGAPLADVETWLTELEDAGVFSRDERGAIYSRRMVEDERLRELRAAGGAQSLRNPNVPRPKDIPEDTHRGYPEGGGAGVSPSSSSSSSPSPSPTTSTPKERHSSSTRVEGVSAADVEAVYNLYPRKVGKGDALKASGKAIQAIKARGEADPVGWLKAKVKTFAESPAGQAGKFTPHPATWFNQGRFDDDPAEWRRRETTETPHRGTQENLTL